MNKFLWIFILSCIALAALRVVLLALVAALALAVVVAVITRPRETLVFMGVIALFGLVSAHPVICITTFGALGVVVVVANAWPKDRKRALLTDRRDER